MSTRITAKAAFTANELTTILEALERALDCGVCEGRPACPRCKRFVRLRAKVREMKGAKREEAARG